MTQVKSFTFYYDQYNLVDTLPLKDKQILLVAMTDYVFKNIEPSNLNNHNQAIFNTLKSQLNVSINNSKRRAKKENRNETGEEPEENQNKTKQEPEENQNKTGEEPEKNKTSGYYNIYNYTYLEGVIGGDEAKIVDLFQSKGIMYSNTPEEQNIVKYLTTVDKELINECIEDALIKNKGNINYIFGIIKNKVRDAEKRKKALPKKETPKWFDKEQKKDEQGLDELKEILEDLGEEENDGNKN